MEPPRCQFWILAGVVSNERSCTLKNEMELPVATQHFLIYRDLNRLKRINKDIQRENNEYAKFDHMRRYAFQEALIRIVKKCPLSYGLGFRNI